MSVSLEEMYARLAAIIRVAELAHEAQIAADRALSDVAAETFHADFDGYVTQLITLIRGEEGQVILAAMAEEFQALIEDFGDDGVVE